MRHRPVRWTFLGRQPYGRVLAWQRALAAEVAQGGQPDRLLICEHDPVITLGRRAGSADLLRSAEDLAAGGIALFEVERGGAATYQDRKSVV